MTLHAATATTLTALVPLVLAAAALTWLAGYAAACWLAPFTRCRWCSATGIRYARLPLMVDRPCRHCDATGRRLRLGRQLYNHLHHQRGRR